MKHPLLFVALLYAGGVVLADNIALSPGWLLPVSLVIGLSALLVAKARAWLLGVLLVLAGVSNQTLRTTPVSPVDLRHLQREDAAIVTLRGRLTETPHHRVYEHDGESSWRTLAELEVRSLRRARGDWQEAKGIVVVSTAGVLAPEFFGGRSVELEGVLRVPRAPIAPGQFDYRKYLQRQGIHFQLHVASTNDWHLAANVAQPARPPLSDRFTRWAQGVLGRGLPHDESTRLLWAMTLGWKTALTGEVSEPFMRSGTMHVFAISGLHIALIAGILVVVLRALFLPTAAAAWIVIPLIWFYTYATGWQASAVRSTVMMSVILAGWALRRPSDMLNSLAAAAFVILLWDPQQLFQAGFQLSFSVVLSLALCVPGFGSSDDRQPQVETGQPPTLLRRMAARVPLVNLLLPDPLLPEELRPRCQRWIEVPRRWLARGTATSFAAWIGSIPLVAFYFNLFTPVSLLANLVVVPLSSGALAANMASLTVGGFLPGMAELFNHTAWLLMGWMVRLSHWAENAPAAWAYVSAPGWAFFGLYYGLLLSVLMGWWKQPRLRWWLVPALGCLAAVWTIQSFLHASETRITILPANGGEVIAIQARGAKHDLLIDCGNDRAAEFIVKPFLRSQGVNKLAALALTHGDINNVGGADFLLTQFRFGEVATSPVSFRSAAYREARAGPAPRRTLQRNEKLGPWTALHPDPSDHFPQADDNALVLHGAIKGTRLLFLSDLGRPGQHVLLERNPNLRADLVVSGLPVKSEPLADGLLDTLQPAVIIITDSLYPATARATSRLRERLAMRPTKVFFTSETGALTLVLKARTCRIESATGELIFHLPVRPSLP